MAYKSMAEMGHSPNEMGHSPAENQNKGYAKQERKDLMQDMPIVKDAMGGRSWMSKHSKSALRMGHESPAKMGHESPAEMHGGFHVKDAAKAIAGGVVKAAKNVKAAGTKIAKAVSADLFEGGSERKRKLREARGGAKPAEVFKK
jgi:hypothetical protein